MHHLAFLKNEKKPTRLSNLIFSGVGLLLIVGLFLTSSLSVFAAPPNPNSPNPPPSANQPAAPVTPAVLISTVCGTHTWLDPVDPNYPGLKNVNVNLDSPLSGSRVRDTFYSRLNFDNGGTGNAFCTDIDLDLPVAPPQPIRFCLDSTAYADWRLVWLLENYPPTPTDRIQNAARQSAVWYITDGFFLRRPDATLEGPGVDAAVLSAYDAILNSIPTTQPPAANLVLPSLTVTPPTATNLLPGQEVHNMEATLTQGAVPMAGVEITLSVTDGGQGTTLSVTNNITDAAGKVYFSIKNTAGLPYTATVNAESTISIPAGSQFTQEIATQFPLQHLGLGSIVPMIVRGSATKTWQNAPQLISVHKFEDFNLNGVQDAGEPSLANWPFTLTLPDATTQGVTTDANGNASFFNVSQTGTFKVSETLPAGWKNTTPLEVIRTRTAPDDLWTTWAVTFGNVRLGSLEVTKTVVWNGVNIGTTQAFQICIVGPSYPVANCKTFNTNNGWTQAWTDLLPGSYTVTETDPGSSWTVTNAIQNITVLPNGGMVSANITNTRRLGSLEVTKSVIWNNATVDQAQAFEICILGPSYPAIPNCKIFNAVNGWTQAWTNLIPGSYSVTETNPGAAWSATNATQNVTVASDGSKASAMITNTLNPGSLNVTKTVTWNNVNPDQNQSFQICILGPSYPTIPNCKIVGYQGGLLSWTNLVPGAYQVSETDPGANWVVTVTGSPAVVPAGAAGSAAVLNETKIPTAVTLSSFEVKSIHGTQVTLTWTTLTEIDNFYYRIYRSNLPDFGTASLIGTKSAVPNGTSGATYEWTDAGVPSGGHWYYWIADMDSTNVEKSHYGYVDALVLNSRVFLPGILKSEVIR